LLLSLNNDNNNIRLIIVKTNRSTLHTVYDIQQSAMQAAMIRHKNVTQDSSNNHVSPGGIGYQKQTAPRFANIRSGGPLPRKHSPYGATKAR